MRAKYAIIVSFMEEGSEAQRGAVTGQVSPSREVVEAII